MTKFNAAPKKVFATFLACVLSFYSLPAVALAQELSASVSEGEALAQEGAAFTEGSAEAGAAEVSTDEQAASGSSADELGPEGADVSTFGGVAGTEEPSSAAAMQGSEGLTQGEPTEGETTPADVELSSEATAVVAATPATSLANGRYTIHSADVFTQVLDVQGGSFDSGANVALWADDGVAWQRFSVSANAEGYYSIVCENSGLYLSCADGAQPGQPCNVVQATGNGGDGQLWALVDAGDGRYKLQSKLTGLFLDVQGGHAGNTVNVQTWEESSNNGGLGQMFSFVEVPNRTVADGTYAIECFDNQLEVLDIMGTSYNAGANVALYNNRNSINQKFRVEQLSNGYYMIMAEYTWQALDVVASGTTNGTNVTQWPQTRASNQQWIIQDAGDGWYYIISKCSGLYLDVEGGHAGDSVNIQTWQKSDNNDGRGQKFRFVKMIDDGMYYIASADNTNMVLDVTAGSRNDGANVTLWNKTGATHQRFEVRQLYGRVYKISCYRSWRSLDVVNSGTANGTNVTQWSQHDGKNQEWLAEVQDDGSVMFKSTCNDLYLDVEGGYAGAGVNVQMWERSDNNSGRGQRFYLQPYSWSFLGVDGLVASLDKVGGGGYQFSGTLNNLSDSVRRDLDAAIANYRGRSLSFALIDLGTGATMAYNGNIRIGAASTIKGPYVVSLNMYKPWSLGGWESYMYDILHWSTNEPYTTLRAYWGSSTLHQLAGLTHAYDFDWNANWVSYSAPTLAKMWMGMSEYILSNRENSDWIRYQLSHNEWITSRSVLSWKNCTIYAKSGWYDPIGTGHNEAYMVMDKDAPYVAVIMTSESNTQSWKMANLMNVLERAHNDLI